MQLTTSHVKYYKDRKFSLSSNLLKAFIPSESHNIHKLVNLHCDFESSLRLERNRPLDKGYKKSNTYNLLRSVNRRIRSKEQLIQTISGWSDKDKERAAIVNRIIRKLNKKK